jgi:hypothetical protein
MAFILPTREGGRSRIGLRHRLALVAERRKPPGSFF